MIVPNRIFNTDGSATESTTELPDGYFDRPSASPTTEERLAALESAMLSMMGVNTDV